LVALLVALLWVLTLGVLAVALLPSWVHFARNAPSAGVANNPPNFRPTGQPLVADRVVARGPRVQ